MQKIKVKCPAKINLDLKVQNRRPDGFHNIISTMQTISLYDYLTISFSSGKDLKIDLSGTCNEIPYDSSNLVYKAALAYLKAAGITSGKFQIEIEKNIPIAAGLAGGSTDAAGTVYGLNKIFDEKLSNEKLHEICASLGSDLNVCLHGGRLKTSGRGENIEPLPSINFPVNLIKPVNLGISAKEAYTEFSQKIQSADLKISREEFVNDLEWAILDKYPQLQYIKNKYPKSIMTGSGSTYFSTDEMFSTEAGYWVQNGLHSIETGVSEA